MVLVDSRAALDYARSCGLEHGARVYTCSPALAVDARVTPLEKTADSGTIRHIAEVIARLGERLHDVVSSDPNWADRALTIARLALSMELPTYKALILIRSVGEAGPVAAVEPRLRQGHRLVGLWEELLDGMLGFEGVLRVPTERLPPRIPTQERNAAFVARLRFEGWESVLYRCVTRAGGLARLVLRRGGILVPAENSLVKEVGWWLACRGYRPISLPREEFSSENLSDGEERSLNALVGPTVRDSLEPLAGPVCARQITAMFIRRASQAVAAYRRARDHWKEVFETLSGGTPRAVVTNYNLRPSGEALYDLCRERDVPHVAVEHGTGLAFSPVLQATPYSSEITICDLFLTYSDASTRVRRENKYRRGAARTVGLPADLAFVSSRKSGIKITPPILYVSCQALMGNVARPIAGGVTDRESVAWETRIINEVLSHLPHRVLFKPYRSVRYLDGNPIHDAARSKDNVEVFEERIDLRYLLIGPRVVIVNHAASTVSWCLLSKLPVVYLDSEEQSPLLPEVREAIRAGTFCFDTEAPDFMDRLRIFLSRTIEEIETEWKDSIPARDQLVERFFGCADGRAGRRGAAAILDLIRSRDHR